MHTPTILACPFPLTLTLPFTRRLPCATAVAALTVLSACQKSPETVAAPSTAVPAKAPVTILGGLQPGDTVTVTNCIQPQPGLCSIAVLATAPAGGSGDACTVAVASAVSLPKTTGTLRWVLQQGDANFDYRFRAAAGTEKAGFGVHIIDNLIYAPAPPASAAPPASSPMQPIWVTQVAQPGQVEMSRTVREWPPRISAYDVYLEYQGKGASGWTACKTWDPIIISRD